MSLHFARVRNTHLKLVKIGRDAAMRKATLPFCWRKTSGKTALDLQPKTFHLEDSKVRCGAPELGLLLTEKTQ